MNHSKKHIYVTIIITAVIAGGLGYYTGTKLTNKQAVATTFQGARTGAGTGRTFSGAGGGLTQGEVVSFDGSMLSVKDRTGGSKVVIVTDATKVLKSVNGSSSDIKTGGNVVVTGTANSDGSVTADSIQLRDSTTMPPMMRAQ